MIIQKIFLYIAITVFILISFSAVWIELKIFNKPVSYHESSIDFEIPKNSSLKEITNILTNSGFDLSFNEFKLTAKWYKNDSKIRYGKFSINPNGKLLLKDLIEFLTKNGSLTKNVTIPEGSRIIDIAHILKKNLKVDSLRFIELTKDPELLKSLNINALTLEGYLYPETYNFNENDNLKDIVIKLHEMYLKKVSGLRHLIDNSDFTEHEIITLASIIQGEVMDRSEYGKISAVYNNRLAKGMLLQADPTVQYLFTKPRRLLNKHIEIDNPYNTYMYKGLPPGPINNPCVDAILAAIKPDDEDFIYMVAKGNGSHYFNTDLNGHLRDKKKLDNLRREQRRKKRGK